MYWPGENKTLLFAHRVNHLKPHKWAKIKYDSRQQTLTNLWIWNIQDWPALAATDLSSCELLSSASAIQALQATSSTTLSDPFRMGGPSPPPLPSQVRGTEDYFNYFIQPLWGQISLRPLSDEMNCCPAAVYQAVTQRELASHKAGTQTLTHHYTRLNTHTHTHIHNNRKKRGLLIILWVKKITLQWIEWNSHCKSCKIMKGSKSQ